jgi:putative holliday junction resolvase
MLYNTALLYMEYLLVKSTNFISFDVGTKRIGVAIGQRITDSARPLNLLKAKDGYPNWEFVDKLVKTWSPQGFVLGLPYFADGKENPTTILAKNFGNKLHQRYNIAVYWIDERLSSYEAEEYLHSLPKKSKGKKAVSLDSMAATFILQSWFNQNPSDLSL